MEIHSFASVKCLTTVLYFRLLYHLVLGQKLEIFIKAMRTLKVEYTEDNTSCNEGKVVNVTVYNILVINKLCYQNSIALLNFTKKSKIIELA